MQNTSFLLDIKSLKGILRIREGSTYGTELKFFGGAIGHSVFHIGEHGY